MKNGQIVWKKFGVDVNVLLVVRYTINSIQNIMNHVLNVEQ